MRLAVLNPLTAARAAYGSIARTAQNVGTALVQATSRLGLTKGAFRATMSSVWLVFNFALIALFAFRGRFDGVTLYRALVLVPVVPVGVCTAVTVTPGSRPPC